MPDELEHPQSHIQDPRVPDALFVPESMKRGRTLWDRMNSILDIAEPMLGVDRSKGDRAYIRRQGDGWLFITKDPEDTIDYPLRTPLQRRPRYVWIDGLDGIRRGYLRAANDR
jgi:hypothetical protein